jgi:hypothetical protein
MNKKTIISIIVAFVILAYVAIVIIIDPYNYFNTRMVSQDVKTRIAFPLNERLSRIIGYKQDPLPNILIGDSRIQNLNVATIKKVTGEDYYNFGYGGCTFPELIDSFWFATKNQKLKNVCIGISFDMYNKYNNTDYFKAALKSSNFFTYIFNITNFKVIYYIARDFLKGEKTTLGIPKITSMESYWQEKIDEQTGKFYKMYKYPDAFLEDLKKIRAYCDENGINLFFFNPPTHLLLLGKIDEFSLKNEYNVFLRDISSIGKTYDFNYVCDFTKDKSNFFDPFHSMRNLDSLIVKTMFIDSLYFRNIYPEELPEKLSE